MKGVGTQTGRLPAKVAWDKALRWYKVVFIRGLGRFIKALVIRIYRDAQLIIRNTRFELRS